MKRCEIIRKAIEFDSPERLPIIFTRDANDDSYPIDYGRPSGGARCWEPWREEKDEWGCVWEKTELDNMGQVKEPPLKNWEIMKDYKFPNPEMEGRFSNLENVLKEAGDRYILLNSPFTLFERMQFLHGVTELLQDFYLHPDKVHELAERVLDFQIGITRYIRRNFKGKVQGFLMTDDWGTQNSTIISLPLWREFFKLRYKKLFAAIHDAGMHTWLHSCGKINDFVSEFIDIGLDVINFGQPTLAGVEEIGNRFAGKICFANFIDIQKTLPLGTLDQIRAEAKMISEKWMTPKGGFIAMGLLDYECLNLSRERIDWMLTAFKEFGYMKYGRL